MLKKSANMVDSRLPAKVDSQVAAQLVDFAMKHTAMENPSANACYQNLIELMTNTHNHAATWKTDGKRLQRRPRKTWFVSVYCRDGKGYFNFIDLGVGILKSAPARNMARKIQKSASSNRTGTLVC